MVLDQYKVQKRQGFTGWERDASEKLVCKECGCPKTSHGVYNGSIYFWVRCDRCGDTCLRKERWTDFELARRNLYENVNHASR